MNSRRSASVGALPREKKHFVSRNESVSGISLDVRCACQFFESDSLLPERVNPVDSRPSSKLGFHGELDSLQEQLQFAANAIAQEEAHEFGRLIGFEDRQQLQHAAVERPSPMPADVISTRSFNVAGHAMHMEYDRVSMRSVGAHPSSESFTPPVDLAFVEKYPELEETARSRGLVVGSIGAVDQPMGGTFLAGVRGRQMSVGALPTSMRDPDAVSIRSGVSVRRISRSPSKTDLFIADINIRPIQHGTQKREQRSASASRRNSNLDLVHYSASHTAPPPPANLYRQSTPQPATHITKAISIPVGSVVEHDALRSPSPRRSPSPAAQDFRTAKPPISTDYMRPSENKEKMDYYQPSDELMPQNRPIDVSKYDASFIAEHGLPLSNKAAEEAPARTLSPLQSMGASQVKMTATDPLQQTVAALEEIAATRNIEDISDHIKLETRRPPSVGDLQPPPLHLDEETQINIVSAVPIVDIDSFVQYENKKAEEEHERRSRPTTRPQSPARRRQLSPTFAADKMDTLQLPAASSRKVDFSTTPNQSQTQSPLKRQRTPDHHPSPERSKKSVSIQQTEPFQSTQPLQLRAVTAKNGNTPIQGPVQESKNSYSARFKSIFSPAKSNDAQPAEAALQRQKSLSPKRERTPSPKPNKILTMITKAQPSTIEHMTSSNVVVTKDPKSEPLAVKVTETFSLKVDEMDQYSTRPQKISQPLPPVSLPGTPPHSRDDFQASERGSVDIADAFVPVVISSGMRQGFMAGNRALYSSEIDMKSRRSDSELPRSSQEQMTVAGQFTIPTRGQLFSAPINIGSSSDVATSAEIRGITPSETGISIRSSSQVRANLPHSKLGHQSPFLDGRTQSQDRSRLSGSHENLFEARISKTVSFNFDERKSRLTEFENTSLSQKHKEKRDFLERTYFSRDHEYEPIGIPPTEIPPSTAKDFPTSRQNELSAQMETLRDEMKNAEELQKDFEDRYFSSEATTPRTESRTDYDIHTSQVDSSALEELPLKPENRKKGFMASAHDRTRRMQAGFKSQAGKIKTKLRSTATKKTPSGSPKAKERKRFKAPEFSKIKMPEIKRPDMSKLKEFKRPEFTKFNKPDMSKFKLPEKFSTLKLHRSKSLKENEPPMHDDTEISGTTPESGGVATGTAEPQKKLFEFNFGTYPRAFRRKKKPVEPVETSFGTGSATEGLSIIPSTDTQPSFESSSSPQGDRGPGPVRSRWADKFSDVSYNDSEGSRSRRYGSEQESFDRESSLERRMKDDLEDTGSEAPDVGILTGTGDTKQFAEFDEENRAIHEISNLRAGEFKRRPMVHQDSDLRSEDSREAVGWTDKEIQKIKLLRKAEIEAEASYLKFPSEEGMTQETQSTASSGKKVVMEEIDDDEFFLRKRGVSEDNIELRQYISNAIREGYDIPMNALEHVGQAREPIEYPDYDVPPPKPRRLHKSYRPEEMSQEFGSQRSDYGDDLSMSQNGSDFFSAPRRPMRKGRSRSKYSVESQDAPRYPVEDEEHVRHEQYFDDDEEYLRPPQRSNSGYKEEAGLMGMNNLDYTEKQAIEEVQSSIAQPQAPQRRKRHLRETSLDKDSFINSLSGRSVSNNYLQPTEDVIVYRTEHEYYKPPLATPENYTDGESAASQKLRFEEEHELISGAIEPDSRFRSVYDDEVEDDIEADNSGLANETNIEDKFIIDMMENDGYAVVRKDQLPKPTPPARRKKFSRSPGERFATVPSVTAKRDATPPPERPPPPKGYTPSMELPPPSPSIDTSQIDEDDYEEPGILGSDRPESPRDLQSGDIINKMKYRPLPPPPRPPREKRQRSESKRFAQDDDSEIEREIQRLHVDESKRFAALSSDESYGQNEDMDLEDGRFQEVEVSTQTDPLPDDFVCEEFEITDDMRVIEPRHRQSPKTLEDLLREEQTTTTFESPQLMSEDEQLARGLQRFRDANQRSMSERSRASSQADRSRSLSRPQTPSAIIIERRVSTPVPSHHENETMLEASLIVRPIDDLDLEEEALRREGLLTDSSQHSKSDISESLAKEDTEDEATRLILSEYSHTPSSVELETAVENLRLLDEIEREVTKSDEEEAGGEDEIDELQQRQRTLRDHGYDDDNDDAERYSNEYDEEQELSDYMKQQQHWPSLDTEEPVLPDAEQKLDQTIEEMIERHIRGDYAGSVEAQSETDIVDASSKDDEQISDEPPPQPPPRRKSAVGIEPSPTLAVIEETAVSKEVTPLRTVEADLRPQVELPAHMGDLEVERLRVRALQAGQIMVSQLHGGQISAEELECKSGNLVVRGLELPPGFIEDIVDRVRSSERSALLTTETQTSLHASNDLLAVEQAMSTQQLTPPPKPPRHRDLEPVERHPNLDEETQTDPQQPPPVFATTEYLETLVPLLRRDLESKRDEQAHSDDGKTSESSQKCRHHQCHQHHHHRHHHHHYRRCSSSSSDLNDDNINDLGAEGDYRSPSSLERRHHSRSRSRTRPPSECPSQSVSQAGRQFISACSLSLVNIIDQLTACVRGGDANKDHETTATDTRLRQVPMLVVLFIIITFGVLIFLLSGRNVHTHHWDFFNLPGNNGRQS